MRSFTDLAGRRWSISLNVTAAKRVRDLCGVNLLAVIDKPELLAELSDDVIQLVDVLYVLCKPQCDAEGVTDEQFGESLGGEVIDNATSAFLTALVDFFPGARRAVLAKIVRRAEMFSQQQENKIQRALDDGEIDALMDEVMESHVMRPTAGKTSTNSPAVPE